NQYTNLVQTASINVPSPTPYPAPAVTLGLSPAGGTVDANGNATVTLPMQGSAMVTASYLATPGNNTPGLDPLGSATLDCGIPGQGTLANLVNGPGGAYAQGGLNCLYTQPGTYSETFTAVDTQKPAKTSTVTRTVTVNPHAQIQ